ncbi:efflux RND transporter periplasmic adaptor subunit [Pseudorhodoferax sp. Leaf274]|uniref:efflux RND transporter periplasmic adaptor subunit n=1 Tax=Pseudorhodoferax sp. Leaf274 TaxID=1736318 RepID=UPI0009EB6FCD|nr:efflux RND transporter periplasmic adaptor subunit [Pseudorhodoferax sp. Leaf274]
MSDPFADPYSDPTQVRPRRNRVLAVGTALVLAMAVAGVVFMLQSPKVHADALPVQPPATPVSVATVAQADVATWDEFSGRLEAVERVDLRSRVAGTVLSVHFREGALVKKGDLLVTIDPASYAADVERAEAQVVAAEARQSFTRSELDRAQRLLDERAIAQREHDERANAHREAQANLRAAQAALQSARLNLSWTQVRAPVAGRAGKVEITVGNLVSAGAGAPVLTTLVSVSPIYASFDADEQVVTRALRELPGGGARTQIERIPVQMGTAADDATPLVGRLQWVDNQVDAKSGTVRVRAQFDNKDGTLMPGQFARLRMGQVKSSAVLLVNERAVGTDQDKKFVIVVDAENKAQWRQVQLGANANGLRIVTQGLQPGERVVVNGLQRVRPGTVVDPQPVAMDARPQGPGQQAKADAAAAAPKS